MRYGDVVRLRVGAAYDDREAEFPLPAGWRATVYPPADAPAMPEGEIADAFAQPIGADSISEAARGARTAVILVDDLGRPTPVEPLSLAAIAELKRAGLKREQITIIIGSATHRPLTQRQARMRLGRAFAQVGKAMSHDSFSPQVEFLGLTSAGTPVLVNEEAARADFSVSVSSVYAHSLTAWGGGAKMILPGISHASTTRYHHNHIPGGPRAGPPGSSRSRRDVEEAGRMFGLAVAVCAVVNSRKELSGLFVGDPTRAHRRAVAFARQVHATDLTGASPDLIIANAYPFDSDSSQLGKGLWAQALLGAPTIIIADMADPLPYHGLLDGPLKPYLRRPRPQPKPQTTEQLMTAGVFLYCPQYGSGFVPRDPRWYCESDWERLMAALSQRFRRASVAVLPVAPVQIPTST